MRHLTVLCSALASTTLAGTIAPRALAAQLFLGFGGVEARAGLADVKNGGSSATFEADLGYILVPALRTTLGVDFFDSALDHAINGQPIGGTMRGAGGVTSLRYDILPRRSFGLHVLAGVTIHSIRAMPDDPSVSDSVGGGHVGAQFGAGVTWRIGSGHFWSATADVRHVAERDVQRTLLAVGLRFSRRGRQMYDREDVAVVTPTPAPPDTDNLAGEAHASTRAPTWSVRLQPDQPRSRITPSAHGHPCPPVS
jgi:hypothetical protein